MSLYLFGFAAGVLLWGGWPTMSVVAPALRPGRPLARGGLLASTFGQVLLAGTPHCAAAARW